MLCPQPRPPVPAETARIVRAAFPKGHAYLAAADALGEVFTDDAFAALFPGTINYYYSGSLWMARQRDQYERYLVTNHHGSRG